MPPKKGKTAFVKVSSNAWKRGGSHRSLYARTRLSRAKPSKRFTQKVQSIISKDTETKVVVYQGSTTAFNQQVNSSGDAMRLMPQIANGTAGNQKLGNMIRLQSLKLRGVITFQLPQTTVNNCRIGVRLLIVKAKRFKDYVQSASDLGTNFNKLLEGTSTGLDGSLAAYNTPVNLDYYSCVYDKRFIMTMSSSASASQVVNDMRQAVKFVNINIPYSRRTLHYDENYSATEPVDYPYMMVISYTKLDGSIPDGAGTAYLTFQYTTVAKFEDE